jgi:hypothetical protein
MQVGLIRLSRIELPGRAGEYQRAGMTAALVAELGDNYAHYHGWLADQLARFEGPPDIDEYADTSKYVDDWAIIHDVVRAEAMLRVCFLFRRDGRPLNRPLDFTRGQTSLVNGDYELVSLV